MCVCVCVCIIICFCMQIAVLFAEGKESDISHVLCTPLVWVYVVVFVFETNCRGSETILVYILYA